MISKLSSAPDCFSLSAHQMGEEGRGEVGFPVKSTFRFLCSLLLISFSLASHATEPFTILKPAAFSHHIERFNSMEDENVTNFVSNAHSWDWLQQNIPFFECPDAEVEKIYFYRWWSFRKHIKQTPKGFVITEFLTPVSHAGDFNTISCAKEFHILEGRWLRDARYVDDYIRFWLRGDDGKPVRKFHNFSSWFAMAVYEDYLVNGNKKFTVGLLNDLVADYRLWEQERQLPNGLFWQYDVRDGMEESISGSRTLKNIRPTINSYMFANAQAIADIARLANKPKLAAEFTTKAGDLKRLTQQHLWDTNASFFKVLIATNASVPFVLSDAREAIGFVPWMFNLPDPAPAHAAAFAQLTDSQGFSAPYGFTTAERRHPQFRSHGVGTCEWDGAIWPFATSQTLYAVANVLRESQTAAPGISSLSPSDGERAGVRGLPIYSQDYFSAFLTYTHSQHANGKPYIGEYQDEVTGDWINGKNGRSRYYNHSTYADLLITGVVGLRPRADNIVEVWPLLSNGTWDWFCLDGVKYHGRMLTILWDKDGSRYGHGAGLQILANGKQIAHAPTLERITGRLP